MTIEPDAKNWTWVLERPCPDCGVDVRAVDLAEVGGLVRDNADAWAIALTHPDATLRATPDMWSPLEYACHVRDVFRIFDGRLGRMVDEDGPTFENWDQDATAIEDGYAEQVPVEVAAEVLAAGGVIAARFDTMPADAWGRPGYRSDGSAFTVESLTRYFVHDLLHHLWDVGAGT